MSKLGVYGGAAHPVDTQPISCELKRLVFTRGTMAGNLLHPHCKLDIFKRIKHIIYEMITQYECE